MNTKAATALKIAQKQGVIRPRDLKAAGIPGEYLWQFYQKGIFARAGRGLYYLPGNKLTEHHSLAEAAKQVPKGVICLLSALQFHELTTQIPSEIWLAIDPKAYKPISDSVMLRIVRFSGAALSAGIAERTIEGVKVKIYCPAKTVADCFKYRNKIGVDVAIEALRDCWQQKRASVDEIWKYAQICRVSRVIKPYLEAII